MDRTKRLLVFVGILFMIGFMGASPAHSDRDRVKILEEDVAACNAEKAQLGVHAKKLERTIDDARAALRRNDVEEAKSVLSIEGETSEASGPKIRKDQILITIDRTDELPMTDEEKLELAQLRVDVKNLREKKASLEEKRRDMERANASAENDWKRWHDHERAKDRPPFRPPYDNDSLGRVRIELGEVERDLKAKSGRLERLAKGEKALRMRVLGQGDEMLRKPLHGDEPVPTRIRYEIIFEGSQARRIQQLGLGAGDRILVRGRVTESRSDWEKLEDASFEEVER